MFEIIRVSGFSQEHFQGWDGSQCQFVDINQVDLEQYKIWFGNSGYRYYYSSSLSSKELHDLKLTIPELNKGSSSIYNLSNACHYN